MSTSPTTWALIWYLGILPILWLAPAMTSWLKRKCHRRSSAQTSDTAPGGFALTSEGAKLESAEQSRKRLYARVSGALWQAGWMVWWYGFLPYATLFLVRIGAPDAMSLEHSSDRRSHAFVGSVKCQNALQCVSDAIGWVQLQMTRDCDGLARVMSERSSGSSAEQHGGVAPVSPAVVPELPPAASDAATAGKNERAHPLDVDPGWRSIWRGSPRKTARTSGGSRPTEKKRRRPRTSRRHLPRLRPPLR
mgnify:CR=1 FL=1